MGWFIALRRRRKAHKIIVRTDIEVAEFTAKLLAETRQLRLGAVCGQATKSGQPCRTRCARGYASCSRHGGKNAAPVAAQQQAAEPVAGTTQPVAGAKRQASGAAGAKRPSRQPSR